MGMLTRFAPSPTGFLHIGGARTALMCFLYAKKAKGKLMLRIDDTDTSRSLEKYIDQLKIDLNWLGIEYDMSECQSSRLDRYKEAIDFLFSKGRLYRCYETAEELDLKRRIQKQNGKPPIYDRASLRLSEEEKNKYISECCPFHIRFKIDINQIITWKDEIKGEISFDAKNISDPIVIREDGTPTYMLPSAIDDIDFAITHVLRGDDHISNTAIQIQIMNCFEANIPNLLIWH